MTNVEKKLNKADLVAYKVYDNRNYALIPGISHNYSPKATKNSSQMTLPTID